MAHFLLAMTSNRYDKVNLIFKVKRKKALRQQAIDSSYRKSKFYARVNKTFFFIFKNFSADISVFLPHSLVFSFPGWPILDTILKTIYDSIHGGPSFRV